MNKEDKLFEKILLESEKNFVELLKKEGMIAGEVFHTQREYIKRKKGVKGLNDFAKKSKELGYEIDLRKADYRGWHPIGLRPFGWLVMLRTFGWGQEELIDSGYQAPQISFIMRILAGYFVSPEVTIKRSPSYWKKHYSTGSLTVPLVDMKNRKFILRIDDFLVSPLFCIFYLGYFRKIVEFGGIKNSKIKETKCMFKGDDYHEFEIIW
ncbi:hypothetical protein K8R62_01755 [bacterium]|nr:hypothetical protein [bacterium]